MKASLALQLYAHSPLPANGLVGAKPYHVNGLRARWYIMLPKIAAVRFGTLLSK